MATLSPQVVEKFRTISANECYRDQAVWYLNAWFTEPKQPASEEAEDIFQLVMDFAKEDFQNKEKGKELNMVQAFNLLQRRNQTLTALQLKAALREADLDSNGEMSLLEYLVYFYKRSPEQTALRPQGSASPEEQAKLDALTAEVQALSKVFDELSAAQAAAEAAQKEVEEARAEAEKIAEEIRAQEKAKQDEIDRLAALSTDMTVGIVKRNMAVQQLAAAKNEDPLPLRKAKLTQEACVRRLDKAVKAAEAATEAATQKAQEAEKQLKAAEASLEELKRTCSGIAHGSVWMLERELAYKKSFLPKRLQ